MNLFSVTLDGLEEGLNVGVDVDDLVAEERHDPAGREREGPQVVGGLIGQCRMTDCEPEDDPSLDRL